MTKGGTVGRAGPRDGGGGVRGRAAPGSRARAAMRRAALPLAALAGLAPAGAAAAEPAGAYAGVFAGLGRADNRIVDLEGFANWGRPGWAVDYRGTGPVAGALAGVALDPGGLPVRIEADIAAGRLAARSDRLDPEGRDETVRASYRWIATARAAVAHRFGRVTGFAGAGPALARIESSVADIDFAADRPPRFDADDSFRARRTKLGWTAGIGVETALAEGWTLRLEASWLDFGRGEGRVNHSGDGRCGPDGPRRPCRYELRHRLGLARLAVIRRFGPRAASGRP